MGVLGQPWDTGGWWRPQEEGSLALGKYHARAQALAPSALSQKGMNTRCGANVPVQFETGVRPGSDPRSSRNERPRRRRNTSNRKQKCSTVKAFGKCSLQPRDESRAASSARLCPNSVNYTPNPDLVKCSGVEMGFLSFFWPRSMRDFSSPTNTSGTRAPCSGFLTGRCALIWGLRAASSQPTVFIHRGVVYFSPHLQPLSRWVTREFGEVAPGTQSNGSCPPSNFSPCVSSCTR